MKWEEVRKTYPDQYVLVRILKSHQEENREIIDEVVIERSIRDPQEATSELVRSRGDRLVYHTGNDRIFLEIRKRPGLRGAI